MCDVLKSVEDEHLIFEMDDEQDMLCIESDEDKQKRLATKQWTPQDIFYKEEDNPWQSRFPDQVNQLHMQLKQQKQLQTAAQNLNAALEQLNLQRQEHWNSMNDQQRRAFKVRERMLRNKRAREIEKEETAAAADTECE
jgi:hypothetical protein